MPQRLALVILAAARQIPKRLQSVQRAVPEVLQVQNHVVGVQLTEPIPVTIVGHVPVQSDHVMDREPILSSNVQHPEPILRPDPSCSPSPSSSELSFLSGEFPVYSQ